VSVRFSLDMEKAAPANRKHIHERIEAELNGLVLASANTKQPKIVDRLKAVRRAWQDYTRGEDDRRCREAALLREVDRVDRQAARVALETERLRRLKDEAMAAVRRLEPDLWLPSSPPHRVLRPMSRAEATGVDEEEDHLLHLNRDLWEVRESLLRGSGGRNEEAEDALRLTDLLRGPPFRPPADVGGSRLLPPVPMGLGRPDYGATHPPAALPPHLYHEYPPPTHPYPHHPPPQHPGYNGYSHPYYYPGPPAPAPYWVGSVPPQHWPAHTQPEEALLEKRLYSPHLDKTPVSLHDRGGHQHAGVSPHDDRPTADPPPQAGPYTSWMIGRSPSEKGQRRRGASRQAATSPDGNEELLLVDDEAADIEDDNTSNDAGDISSGELSSLGEEQKRRREANLGRPSPGSAVPANSRRSRQASSRPRPATSRPARQASSRHRQTPVQSQQRQEQNDNLQESRPSKTVDQKAGGQDGTVKMARAGKREIEVVNATKEETRERRNKDEPLLMEKRQEEPLERGKEEDQGQGQGETAELRGEGEEEEDLEKESLLDQGPLLSEPDQNYILG
jgi:hypothetical protein